MLIKGPRARLVFEEMIRQLGDTVPSEVHLTVRGTGRRCYLTAASGMTHPSEDWPGGSKATSTRGTFNAEIAISGGYGAWIPFLPRALATKLAMVDILETIQSAISINRTTPWPGRGLAVKAVNDGDRIRLWFEDPDGYTQPAVVIPTDFGTET